jgi:hypothetical protein
VRSDQIDQRSLLADEQMASPSEVRQLCCSGVLVGVDPRGRLTNRLNPCRVCRGINRTV